MEYSFVLPINLADMKLTVLVNIIFYTFLIDEQTKTIPYEIVY